MVTLRPLPSNCHCWGAAQVPSATTTTPNPNLTPTLTPIPKLPAAAYAPAGCIGRAQEAQLLGAGGRQRHCAVLAHHLAAARAG